MDIKKPSYIAVAATATTAALTGAATMILLPGVAGLALGFTAGGVVGGACYFASKRIMALNDDRQQYLANSAVNKMVENRNRTVTRSAPTSQKQDSSLDQNREQRLRMMKQMGAYLLAEGSKMGVFSPNNPERAFKIFSGQQSVVGTPYQRLTKEKLDDCEVMNDQLEKQFKETLTQASRQLGKARDERQVSAQTARELRVGQCGELARLANQLYLETWGHQAGVVVKKGALSFHKADDQFLGNHSFMILFSNNAPPYEKYIIRSKENMTSTLSLRDTMARIAPGSDFVVVDIWAGVCWSSDNPEGEKASFGLRYANDSVVYLAFRNFVDH